MEYPKGTGKRVPKIAVSKFYGISHNAVSKDGYFSDCRNVVSEFPVIHTGSGLTSEENELTNITAMVKVTGVDGFCGVADGKVYWNAAEIGVAAESRFTPLISQFTPQANSEKYAYMFNKYMYIWEKRQSGKTVIYRYDTINRENKNPNLVRQVGVMYSSTLKSRNADYYFFGFPSSYDTIAVDDTKRYVIAGAEGSEYIYMPIREFDYEYEAGDPMFAKAYYDGYGGGIETYKFYLYAKNGHIETNDVQLGERTFFYEYGHYPMQATRPEVWKNRVWQARLSGGAIIATAFNSGEDYYAFNDTSADSVEINVATEGGFVGVFAYNESLLAFKKNSITIIYGDTADDFAIGKTIEGVGTCDIKSVVSIGGALYFCDGEAFYMYKGGFPRNISQNLKFKFTDCVCYASESRYIAEGTNEDGSKIIYTYDTETGIWLAEAPIGIKGVVKYEKDTYLITENGIKKPKKAKDWESANAFWYIESADLYEGIFEKKGISEMFIRAKIGANSTLSVFIVTDDGKMPIKTIYGSGKLQTYRIPIAYAQKEVYRYRLEGNGTAMIYDIERSVSVGGRNISEFNN